MSEIIWRNVDDLRDAPWNPPIRVQSVNLRDLVMSMRKFGFLPTEPIQVTRDLMIVDGHRRKAAAKIVGISHVPTVAMDGSVDARTAYVSINATTRKLSSREWLHCYLSGGEVPAHVKARINRIERACGRNMLYRIANANLSPQSLIQVGVSALKYIQVDTNDDVMLNKVITWMVDGKRQWQVRAAIFFYGRKVPIEELRNAISEDRDIDLAKITS